MSWRNVKLILMREVRDQMRDRRTLFMIAILPLLLYPAMGVGMMQMTVLFSEQPRTVVILGAEYLPAHPSFLDGNQIASGWFNNSLDAEKLHVITDLPIEKSTKDEPNLKDAKLLKQAKRFHTPVRKRRAIKEFVVRTNREIQQLIGAKKVAKEADETDKIDQLDEKISSLYQQMDEMKQKLIPLEREISDLFADSNIQVVLVIPDGFADRIRQVNQALKERRIDSEIIDQHFGPTPIANRANEKSLIAYTRVKQALINWEDKILEHRLAEANLPPTMATPVNPDTIDVAQEEEIAANLWSKLFPALLVIMAVTGAFYPAVDLAAGEKERGTMETLLICPASRTEIVVGKFFTVMLFSMSTALLNLASMGLTGKYMVSLMSSSAGGPFSNATEIAFPSGAALMWLVILLIPLAALFSALCLALATFARSSKEGQYYLTPILMVTLGITVFCLSPAVEITPFFSIMPVAGIALLLKGLLLSSNNSVLYIYVIPVLTTSIGYSLLALWWAIEQFKSEDVLFREAERFEVGLWVRHLLRDKESTPSFAEAGFCFVMIMLLQFASMKFMGQAIASVPPEMVGSSMMKLLMIQQLVIIACPALFMGVMLTTSVVKTFRLRLPSVGMLAAGFVLPFVLHPLSLELVARLQWFFPQLPSRAIEAMASMSDGNQPLWFVLLAFAIVPALCEETAFRGFILSGFGRSGRIGLAVILSSVTFGIMHMIPQQVFNATLLGLVLGLIAIRSNSLLPGILFHFIYNTLGVLHSRVDASWADGSPVWWFVMVKDESIRYRWPTLVISAIVAVVILRWLVNRTAEHQNDHPTSSNIPPETSSISEDAITDESAIEVRQ